MFLAVAGQASNTIAQAAHGTRTLRIQNGQSFVNEKLAYASFSMGLAPFSYIFIYLPEYGLITFSDAPFEGANEGGASEGNTLSFHAGDADVRVESSTAMLGTSAALPIWIRFDPEYKLEVKSVVLGYGDQATAPTKWPACTKEKR